MYYLIPYISTTFCESQWRHNSSGIYSSQPNLSEPDNALSSLTFTCFGIWGLLTRKQTNQYYTLMNLNILTGISSYLHHYYYTDTKWAYSADIINVQLLSSYILFYTVCDIELINTSIPLLRQILGLLIIFNCEVMIIFYNIGYGPRNTQLQIVMLFIILVQIKYSYSILKNKLLLRETKLKFIMSQFLSFILFCVACVMWYIDGECYSWMHYSFNAHSIWHISVSWSEFIIINLANQYLSIKYNKIYRIISPFPIKLLLFKVEMTNKRADIDEQSTMIDLQDIITLDKNLNRIKNHRRTQSHS